MFKTDDWVWRKTTLVPKIFVLADSTFPQRSPIAAAQRVQILGGWCLDLAGTLSLLGWFDGVGNMDFFMIQIMGGFYDPIRECPQDATREATLFCKQNQKNTCIIIWVCLNICYPQLQWGIISFPILMPAWGVPNGIRHTQMSYCWL